MHQLFINYAKGNTAVIIIINIHKLFINYAKGNTAVIIIIKMHKLLNTGLFNNYRSDHNYVLIKY